LAARDPIVRRTDLSAKGIYYRTMVGPFASMEKAAGMCRKLKAAGGNCLINEIERRARPSVGRLLVLIFQAPHPSTMNGDNLD
jgi:SPOR domain